MDPKYLIGAVLLFAGACGGIVLACVSKYVRDVFFFLLVTLSPLTERIDINFVSRDWYRGTTCGFEVSCVDILSISLLVSAVLFPRHGTKRWFWPAGFGMMLIFFCYAAFSVAIADPKLFGLFELSKMIRGLIVFGAAALYVQRERELRLLAFALAVAVCYQGFQALLQRYHYGIHRVFGTVDDSNSLSMYLCTTAPVMVAIVTSRFPKYLKALATLAIALACVGVILTISRAGVVALVLMLAGVTAATASFRLTPKHLTLALLVLVAAAGVAAKSWNTLKTRFAESTLEEEYENKHNMGRGYYIRIATTIAEDHWFGVGLNNWSYWVSNVYGPKLGWRFVPYPDADREPSHIVPPGRNVDDAQAAPAHSLGALTAGEMGVVGLVLFTLLWLRWLQIGATFLWPRTPDPMRRMGAGFCFGIGGTLMQSMTEWVFHQTPIYFTFHILIGALAGLYYVKQRERREKKLKELDELNEFDESNEFNEVGAPSFNQSPL